MWARRMGKRWSAERVHLGSSSRNSVVPRGLNESHMSESWPSPKTRKLHGARDCSTSKDLRISPLVC